MTVGETTCKCTVGQVADEPIAPGESVPVKLEWNTKSTDRQFRVSATIHTNDPFSPRVNLNVVGQVTTATSYHPRQFLFGNVPHGTSREAIVRIVSLQEEDFAIEDFEFLPTEASEYFDVEIGDLPEEEYPAADVMRGYKVVVTSNSTLPFGQIEGWLKLRTNSSEQPEFDIRLSGKVVSDFSIFGQGYDAERDLLKVDGVRGRMVPSGNYTSSYGEIPRKRSHWTSRTFSQISWRLSCCRASSSKRESYSTHWWFVSRPVRPPPSTRAAMTANSVVSRSKRRIRACRNLMFSCASRSSNLMGTCGIPLAHHPGTAPN